MAEALQAAPPDTQGAAGNDIASSLLEIADQAGQNPFDIYEYMNSLLASFPPEPSVMLLFELIAAKKEVIDQAVAGFVLHPDAVPAQSVAEALATSATRTLDATIRAMRLNASPPVKTELPRIIKCSCDGSGTRSLFVVLSRCQIQHATILLAH